MPSGPTTGEPFLRCPTCGVRLLPEHAACWRCGQPRPSSTAIPPTSHPLVGGPPIATARPGTGRLPVSGPLVSRSDGAAAWLRRLVSACLALAAMVAPSSALLTLSPQSDGTLVALAGLAALLYVAVSIVMTVVFLVWIHRLHQDLRQRFPDYPITPGQAVARMAIPLYNLWGIYSVYGTLATRLQAEGGPLAALGARLRSTIPWLYVFWISSGVLGRGIISLALVDATGPGVAAVDLAIGAVDVVLYLIYLRLIAIGSQAAVPAPILDEASRTA